MKFPIVVTKKKDKYGDRVFEAFCPLFHDARTFSPCDDKHDAIEEVQEIIQDNVDELLDARKALPVLPKEEQYKKQFPDAKVYWVKIEVYDDIDGDDDELEVDEEDEEKKKKKDDEDDYMLDDDEEEDDVDEE